MALTPKRAPARAPVPSVALSDPQTGLVIRDWYSYLASLRLSVPTLRPDGTPTPPDGTTVLYSYADDAAAAAGGVAVNGLYRTGSIVKIRVA